MPSVRILAAHIVVRAKLDLLEMEKLAAVRLDNSRIIYVHYHSILFFLPFYWPRAYHVIYKYLPTKNGLLVCTTVQSYFAANNVLPLRSCVHLLCPLAFNSFIAKYCDLSVASRSLLATDKSRYFVQPRLINC